MPKYLDRELHICAEDDGQGYLGFGAMATVGKLKVTLGLSYNTQAGKNGLAKGI